MNTTILIFIIVIIAGFIFKKKIQLHFFPEKEKNLTIDQQFNSDKREREKEIDRLLSKMGKNGINDLSSRDKKSLDEN